MSAFDDLHAAHLKEVAGLHKDISRLQGERDTLLAQLREAARTLRLCSVSLDAYGAHAESGLAVAEYADAARVIGAVTGEVCATPSAKEKAEADLRAAYRALDEK
jgi:hypothetical protein